MKVKICLLLFLVCGFFAYISSVKAQEPLPLRAQVDRSQLALGETLNLTIIVSSSGFNSPRPALPDLPEFEIVGTSTSSQLSIVNGKVSSQSSYIFTLRPTQSGELIIPSVSMELDGQIYSTDALKIQVEAQGISPQGAPLSPSYQPPSQGVKAGSDAFIEAEVDNKTPYQGQAVRYFFRFYRAIRLYDQPYYQAPTFQGFWSDPNTQQNQFSKNLAGRLYVVSEVQTTLYPTVTGKVTIEAARLTIPGGFFESDTKLKAEAITLDVKPLPDGAPQGFKGAVGQFTLTAEVTPKKVNVNDAVTLKVTLKGSGNLNNLPSPDWFDMPHWRTFESKVASSPTQTQTGKDERIFERLLVPAQEGAYTIPPVEYIFFDPQKGLYQTASSQPLEVVVSAATAAESSPTQVFGVEQKDVRQIAQDIRYLKPVPSTFYTPSISLVYMPLYWWGYGIPLVGLAVHLLWQWHERRMKANSGLLRSSQAYRKARKAIRSARGNNLTSSAQILTNYLADKFNQPIAGLTYEALSDLCLEKGISSALAQKVKDFLIRCDQGRFTPRPEQEQDDLTEVENLLRALEGEI